MLHFAQQINSGRFQQYDYGAKKNLEFYNTTYAPSYNLTKLNVPLALFYADNDWLAAPKVNYDFYNFYLIVNVLYMMIYLFIL